MPICCVKAYCRKSVMATHSFSHWSIIFTDLCLCATSMPGSEDTPMTPYPQQVLWTSGWRQITSEKKFFKWTFCLCFD